MSFKLNIFVCQALQKLYESIIRNPVEQKMSHFKSCDTKAIYTNVSSIFGVFV